MSNNAAVTADGGEIGRAQALQARAAGRAAERPHEPGPAQAAERDRLRRWSCRAAWSAPRRRASIRPGSPGSWRRCSTASGGFPAKADLVLVEGAGSASEVNLRASDIANMGFARAAGVPVVLVGDIDRGGVIASLVGTRAVLDEADAAMVRGFIVNRFRGDPTLFEDGMRFIAERTGWPALGLVPHFPTRRGCPPRTASGCARASAAQGSVVIAVPVTPRISNFDDLDPLREEPGVELALVEPGEPIPAEAALVLLPGSKTTIDDLLFMRAQGWDIDLKAHCAEAGACSASAAATRCSEGASRTRTASRARPGGRSRAWVFSTSRRR